MVSNEDRESLVRFLEERTRQGQFPLRAFAVETNALHVWTCNSYQLERAPVKIRDRHSESSNPLAVPLDDFIQYRDGVASGDVPGAIFRFCFGCRIDTSDESVVRSLEELLRRYGEDTPQSGIPRDSLQDLLNWLFELTSYGLYPITGYSIEHDTLSVLTTNIPDLDSAIIILSHTCERGYNLGHWIPIAQISRLAAENTHIFRIRKRKFSGLNRDAASGLGRIIQAFGAPYFSQKAVGLVDIVGFSLLTPAQQLAYLYSLQNMLRSSIRRCYRFCDSLGVSEDIGFESTGDGYYVWHEDLDGRCDLITFTLITAILTQAEAFRRKGNFPLRLRASYVIDSVYQMYEPANLQWIVADMSSDLIDLSDNRLRLPAARVTGPATITAERLLRCARPSQYIVADFERPGKDQSKMNVESLIEQANSLFALEDGGGATLECLPKGPLKAFDKNNVSRYCWNVVGTVNNVSGLRETPYPQSIGLRVDNTPNLSDVDFCEDVGHSLP